MSGHTEQRERIDIAFRYWITVCGLDSWRFFFNWVDHGSDERGADMTISPSWEYMTAVVHVYLEKLMPRSSRELDELVCHELTHCLLATIAPEGVDKLEELAVTMISRALVKASGRC